jgi:hypothetical protein
VDELACAVDIEPLRLALEVHFAAGATSCSP